MCILDRGIMKRPPAIMFSVNVVSVTSPLFPCIVQMPPTLKSDKSDFQHTAVDC